jgi:lipopolysaccharide transport system ATP-binding protein
MNSSAIRVEGLSKLYRIGAKQQSYRMLRDHLSDGFKALFRRGDESSDTFWALKDVSFAVGEGEVVGIIGRNGAGKSTLLKILSRITEPTEGYADIYGRVGSLLEVGTGFHPELTGRENIYLNGVILGMKKAEVARRFDEIVAFGEVEKFIDTPVKHYSTGMYLRLAFAVAAHLEPQILVVDEVLAVGDASFQQKCLNKMEDVGKEGRTVLFVSHNMQAVTRLCRRVLLVEGGRIRLDGAAHEVVGAYLNSERSVGAAREWRNAATAPGNEIVRLLSVRVLSESGETANLVDIRRPVAVEMEYEVMTSGHVLVPQFAFDNESGVRIFTTFDSDPAWRRTPRSAGRYVSTAWIPGNYLAEGTLFVRAGIFTLQPYKMHLVERNVAAFQVADTLDSDSARGDFDGHLPGVVRPLLKWHTRVGRSDSEVSIEPLRETATFVK